jgi:hypothetical protein
MYLKMFPDKQTALINIAKTFEEMRTMIIEKGEAISKISGGKIPANPFARGKSNRKSVVEKGAFKVDKEIDENRLRLVIKHNGHFTFMLKELMKHYPCYTTIRNPLAIIASWNSINAPVSKGNLNVLKKLDSDLYSTLNAIPDLIGRQVELLNRIYKELREVHEKHIIKYEYLVSDPVKSLSEIHPEAHMLIERLENKNKNKNYNQDLVGKAGNMLLKKGGYWEEFYSNSEISALMEMYN